MSAGSKGAPVQQRVTAGQSPVGAVLTLREYFAAHAPYMPDELLAVALDDIAGVGRQASLAFTAALFAKWAYEYADAMLAERERQP